MVVSNGWFLMDNPIKMGDFIPRSSIISYHSPVAFRSARIFVGRFLPVASVWWSMPRMSRWTRTRRCCRPLEMGQGGTVGPGRAGSRWWFFRVAEWISWWISWCFNGWSLWDMMFSEPMMMWLLMWYLGVLENDVYPLDGMGCLLRQTQVEERI